MRSDLEEIKNLIDNSKKIVITTHHNPDGDAVGSALGLAIALNSWNSNLDIKVITPNEFPEFLNFMPATDTIHDYEKDPEACAKMCDEAEIVFCLDYNNLSRIHSLGTSVHHTPGTRVLVDHHLDPDPEVAPLWHWDDRASSTCELIYDLLQGLGMADHITKDAAECLYVGIMTDTGSFRYSSTTSKVHRIIADLHDRGVDGTAAHEAVYDSFSENRMRFFGYCISEKLEIVPGMNTAIISVTQEELNRFDIQVGDTEGLVNYGLALKGIKFTVMMTDRGHMIRISFRSKGDFPANEVASKHFHGGGHRNAAGGRSNESLEDTKIKFKEVLKDYEGQLKGE